MTNISVYSITLLAGIIAGSRNAPPPGGAGTAEPVRVVTSLSTYGAIAQEIVGDRGTVVSIGRGTENPHYVQPRPSFAVELRRADMFVATGLDLELWVPALLDKANNPQVNTGGPGYVTAYTGVRLVDIPTSTSRSEGDIHVFGNPHIWADPVNAIVIGQNILTGLSRVDPADAPYFQQRFADWRHRLLSALAGDDLIAILGDDVAFNLLEQNKFWDFVEGRQYQGQPLATRVGGWFKQAEAFRGKTMVCYHKEWDYFSRRFDIPCVAFVEPKPGIPPTPGHVAKLIAQIRDEHIPVILSANFYNHSQVRTIAERTGTTAVIVPASTGGAAGTDTYIDLVNLWVREIATAFAPAN
jgi:zinc/manganese transport system substrate-binding protein